MWTEKYRPRTLEEIRDQTEIVKRLKQFVESRTMPHCLFAGPPGSGKTTAALCLANDLFGKRFQDAFLELNASDARGIDVVRSTIKQWASFAPHSAVPFKILVLDEADNMTGDAQHALRRTMELYTGSCRFILCCNYSGKIIEPIQSRCALFRFTPLPEDDVAEFLGYISKAEGVKVSSGGSKALIEASEGDLRKAVNILQAVAAQKRVVEEETVYEVVAQAKPKDVREMLETAVGGDFEKARERLRAMLVMQGLSGPDIVRQIHSEIYRLQIPERAKVEAIEALGEIDFRLVQGANDEVQLSSLLAKLGLVGKK